MTLDRSHRRAPRLPNVFNAVRLAVRFVILLLALLPATSVPAQRRPHAKPALRILCVFAHPDDETFFSGTLAIAAKRGCEVHTLYISSGEHGKDASHRGLDGAALAAEREQEVQAALKTLGVREPPSFGHQEDSPHVADTEAESAALKAYFDIISDELRKFDPKLVITLGPDGETGHFQHKLVSSATTLAFDTTGIGDVLLYGVSSQPRRAPITKQMPTYGRGPFSVAPRRVSLVVNIKPVLAMKLKAIADHKTQFDPWTLKTLGALHRTQPIEEFIVARSVRRIRSLDDLLKLPR